MTRQMNCYDILVRLNLYVMTEKKLDLGLQAIFFLGGVLLLPIRTTTHAQAALFTSFIN